MMEQYPIYWPQFYTATILEWKPLLNQDKYKQVIVESLQFFTTNLVAFFIAHAMLLYNKTDVVDDVLLGDCGGQQIVVMGKKKPHFLCIVADGAVAILLCQQRIVQLLKAALSLWRKRYFTVLIFFNMIIFFSECLRSYFYGVNDSSPEVLVQHGVCCYAGGRNNNQLQLTINFISGRRNGLILILRCYAL
jgi:hypothetical protein